MSKELKVEINIADYFSADEMRNIAKDVFISRIRYLMDNERVIERILSNSAYDIVGDMIEKKCQIDLGKELEVKCEKIINDDNTLRFELFRDYDGKKGIGLVLLEKIVTEKLQDKLEKVAENIIKNIKLDTKKFEKLVAEKVAEKVANRLK
jgi:hypothetical protein